MLVQLAKGLNELHLNTSDGKLDLVAGEQVQMDPLQASNLIKQGLLVKTEYKEFKNDEIVSIQFKNEAGWRPIEKKVK